MRDQDSSLTMSEAKKHSFCKFFLQEPLPESIRIPPAFCKHLKGKRSGVVYLSGPSKDTWKVGLMKNSYGIYLGQGWSKFVTDHSIEVGDCLIFMFDGDAMFKVTIYDLTGCEKPLPFGPQQDTIDMEEEPIKLEEESDVDLPVSHSSRPFFIVKMKRYNVNYTWFLDIPSAFAKAYLSSYGSKQQVVLCHEGKQWLVNAVCNHWRCSMGRGWVRFVRDNELKIGDSCKFELQDEFRFRITIMRE